MITFSCTSCQKMLAVKENLAGKKVKCPGCTAVMLIPAPVEAPTAALSSAVSGKSSTLPVSTEKPASEFTDPPTAPSPSQAGVTQDLASPPGGRDTSLTDFLAPPQADGELGRLGGFRILQVLGHGGMGVVFVGEDPKLGRKVAIKAMLPHLAQSKTSQERFIREARSAATLEHDHIVAIHHVGEDRGAPFIVMPLLKGEPLDRRLQRDAKLPIPEVLRIGREIAEGLAAAHATGLIHRDIKPGNIWLEASASGQWPVASDVTTADAQLAPGPCPPPTARVKILDFGLARAAAQEVGLTQQGAIIGTPAYMAPEQGRGDTVDARCDLWSLGVLLYRICTGQMPFKGNDTVATLLAVATTDPTRPAHLNRDVPAGLSNLVMKLLEKDPAKRIASAQEVVKRWAALETESKSSDPVSVPLAQPVKDRRTVVGLAAAGGLMLAAIVTAIVLFWPTALGMVRIESDDPGVEIVFDRTGPTFHGSSKEPIALAPGPHAVLLKRGGFTLETDKLLVKKRETITLRIAVLNDKIQILADGQVLAAGALPAVAAVPAGPPVLAPPAGNKFISSFGMEFVIIPRGKAWLGGGGGKPGNKQVDIPYDFYLGVYEVAQEEWQKIMKANPSHFSRLGEGHVKLRDIPDAVLRRFPVEHVSWADAQLFLSLLNEREKRPGWEYRLPTEVEWEYACRGGPGEKKESKFDYYFDKPTNTLLPALANYDHPDSPDRTYKVGSFPPNRLGLYDMHGNVWEWCDDSVLDEKGAPTRVNRGGSWNNDADRCRAVDRFFNAATDRDEETGLRIALTPVGSKRK